MVFCLGSDDLGKSQSGFTLLEVLVAVAILGMAYLVILQNYSISLQNIDRLERNGMRLLSAQIEMDKYFSTESFDEETDGEVYAEDGAYKVMLVSSEEDERLITLVIKKQ